MILYHISKANKEEILERGLKGAYTTIVTSITNKALREAGYDEIADKRDEAVFLSLIPSEDKTKVTIDVDSLELSKLYVSDEVIAHKIFALTTTGRDGSKFCESYANMFMSYEEYMEKKPFLKRPEFIYIGDIDTKSIVNIESSDSKEEAKVYYNSEMKDFFISK